MRTRFRIGTAIVAAAAVSMVGLPAQALTTDDADRLANHIAEVAPDQGPVMSTATVGTQTVDGTSITVPDTTEAPVKVGSFDILLPTEVSADPAKVADDGTVVYQGRRNTADVALQVLGDGSLRMQTVTKSANHAHRFSYTFGADTVLQRDEDDQTVWVTEVIDGEPVALKIDPAWARDATGAPVPTRYRIDGTRLVQIIEPTADTVYPIVADPKTKLLGAALAIKFNKAETRDLAGAAGVTGGCAAMNKKYVWFGKVRKTLVVPCTVWGAYLFAQANIAKGQNACVGLTLLPAPGHVLRYKDKDCS